MVQGGVLARREDHSKVGFEPGVLSCGVMMCNVSQDVLAACSCLGEGLAYAGSRLPNGHEGAHKFEEGNF